MIQSKYSSSNEDNSENWVMIIIVIAVLYIMAILGLSIYSYIIKGELLNSLLLLVAGIFGVPISLFIFGGIVALLVMAIYHGYAYMREKKNELSLHWLLLGLVGITFGGYFAFCFLTDDLMFKYGCVYYPYETRGYYHGDEECHYLLEEDEDNYSSDYCNHILLVAQLHGYKPCHDCIDPDKEYGSRTMSVIFYLIFITAVIGYCEYKARKEEKDKNDYSYRRR